jgi:hypothetical protein
VTSPPLPGLERPTLQTIMEAGFEATNITVKELMFDGNRYDPAAGINCLQANSHYYDLEVSRGGTFLVEWVNFISAPGDALHLAGTGSAVRYSNFGQGGYGIGPGSTAERALSGPETATRSTAIRIEGTDVWAWANFVSYAGTAGINLAGNNPGEHSGLVAQPSQHAGLPLRANSLQVLKPTDLAIGFSTMRSRVTLDQECSLRVLSPRA